MTGRRSFLRSLLAGVVLGVVSSIPGLSKIPVTPERPWAQIEELTTLIITRVDYETKTVTVRRADGLPLDLRASVPAHGYTWKTEA